MREPVTFTSKVAIEHRPTLERLLFFNGCQNRVARRVAEVIGRYGSPEIQPGGEWLRVRLAGLAGVLSAPLAGVQPAMGTEILTATFVAVATGGLGSFWGVVLAALLVAGIGLLAREFASPGADRLSTSENPW